MRRQGCISQAPLHLSARTCPGTFLQSFHTHNALAMSVLLRLLAKRSQTIRHLKSKEYGFGIFSTTKQKTRQNAQCPAPFGACILENGQEIGNPLYEAIFTVCTCSELLGAHGDSKTFYTVLSTRTCYLCF